jgi:cytoskeletal protein CcmA (bactofilin family)
MNLSPRVAHSRRCTDEALPATEPAGFTLIQAPLQVTGDLYAEEPVRVAGHLRGHVVSSESVVVERSGTVQGDVDGQDVIVEGTVEGNVRATRKFELRLTGRVRGDVSARSIAIADGSFLHGKVVALEQEPIRFREKRRGVRPNRP